MATRNIVPRANNEGQLGTTSKKWADVNSTLINGLVFPTNRIIQIKVTSDSDVLTVADGLVYFAVPIELNGMNLVDADAFVSTASTSGLPTVQVHNLTDAVDMLSTKITIDENEFTSYTAVTQPVIDTAHDDVATGDMLRIDVDVAGTGAKGLGVTLSFR